jgi:predicted membrane channel-forming protein YqfA (hemolysin III family)
MVSFRKICLAGLFLWLCVAIILNVLGLNLFFPFNISMTPEEKLYRLGVVRFSVACLLALIVFRYLFEFRPLPSLVIVFWYAVFFFIGGIIYAIKLDIEIEKLYFLIGAVVFGILIQLEIMQKKRESRGSLYKREHF